MSPGTTASDAFGFTPVPPAPVLETGGLAPVYWPPFLIGIVCFLLLGAAMMIVRLHQETSSREIDSLRRELHAL